MGKSEFQVIYSSFWTFSEYYVHSPEAQDYRIKEMDMLPHFMVLKFYVDTGVEEANEEEMFI